MPARNQPGLMGARLGIEPGVPDRGVRLAGAGAHIRCGLKQHHLQALAHQGAGNSAADDSATDHRNVKGVLHEDDYRCFG